MSILRVLISFCLLTTCSSYPRRASNDTLADARDHPYVARLEYLNYVDYPELQYIWQGTIVSPRRILSLDYPIESRPTIAVKVLVGLTNINEKGQVTNVDSYTCHPTFRMICMLKTTHPLKFNDKVQKAELDLKGEEFSVANFTGFFYQPEISVVLLESLQLRNLEMKIGTDDECQKTIERESRVYESEIEICLLSRKSDDPCGAHGAGFVVRSENKFLIIGVSNFYDCATYTVGRKVSKFADWVLKVIESDG